MSGLGKASFLLLSLSIGGCSIAEHEKPISDFFIATDNAETAFIGLDNQVTAAYTALQSKRVVEREIQPRFLIKGGSRELPGCINALPN